MPKLYIQTYGCQMNAYDSAKMADVLHASHQLEKTTDPDEADVLLLNSCSIREKAQEKVFSDLGRWRLLKEKKPGVIIGVGGCVASQEGKDIIKRAPFVDLVFGPQTIHRLGEMVTEVQSLRHAVVDISFPEVEKFDNLPEPRAEGITALVSIMEGCSKYCSFCVVPYTRGEEVSRSVDSVLAEIVSLAEQGVREVTLLGQNVNDYRGALHEGGIADFPHLLHYIAAIEGILRIRFITSHPLSFSPRLIQAFAELPQLANYLHLPVQSGSDRILAAMKRGYTALEYKSKIRKLRQARPSLSLTSDFIIGFPGETEADFQATLDLIREIGFDHSFSFVYSPRPGTPAAQLPDDVTPEEKKRRLQLVQETIDAQGRALSAAMVGTEQAVLVFGHSERHPGEQTGRTENNRVVSFKSGRNCLGKLVKVKVTEVHRNSLRGEFIESVIPTRF